MSDRCSRSGTAPTAGGRHEQREKKVSLRNPPSLRWLPQAILIALLASNGVYFALQGSTTKAADSGAWLILLVLFLAETHLRATLNAPVKRFASQAARLVAGAAVIAAAIGYIVEGNRFDAVNSAVWIAVVVLLEVELRWPEIVGRARRAFTATAVVLYSTLTVLVFAWAARGEWIDAYDAALWLIAFAALEVDVVKKAGRCAKALPSHRPA